ncbi:MAG: ASCH domain-containing protein [Bryobacterales bacterium]|nr:ASCH domain-containing protein [Bryobacterales bacterium]
MALSATSTAPRVASSRSPKTTSSRSSSCPNPTTALLSIKPEYAEAIFAGTKRYEFRRTVFRQDVRVVVVYITNPVGQVAGEFSVENIITDDVDALWDRTESEAGIDREGFFSYFSGRDVGHAIAIGKVKRYREPRDINAAYGVRPPQSFLYL